MTNYTPDFGDGIRYEELSDVTVDELERMPLPCTAELYDGKVVFKLNTFAEGMISANIGYRIGMFLKSHPVGYALCNLNFRLGLDRPKECRAPDVAVVLKENIPKDWNRFLPYAPDMAIEILSPNDSFEKMMKKVNEYLTRGVKLVWVVIVSTLILHSVARLPDIKTRF